MSRYYFAIRYLPKNADCTLLAGRCLSILHGFLRRHPFAGIGVSFPDWGENTIGVSIAFVSAEKAVLRQLIHQPYFAMMASDRLFELTEVAEVPEAGSEIRFTRNQGIAKCFAGEKRRRLARAKRRAASRGEPFRPVAETHGREITPFHCALMESKSTGQQYLLHIQREDGASQVCDDFGGYGLATNCHHRGTVPELPGSNTLFSTLI
ncbi:type I-F CRISPR-associated endoribonuclease Cas6/Csy4 [Ferrimonas sediminicola]|uniref:Type I-F CRISPR-associated endoribonuclease Cas6/Csy4 n=1 Tax=Ferrimonas sediminicola TaxID=2569538 RepID=A0A4U1B6R2_9GAMM|nr:type I-F CRISPR-associated endoribonuclease Cas6/Csy4 [Ferrimonas sediminicola]